MKSFPTFLFACLTIFCALSLQAQKEEIKYPELAKEIRKMRDEDQKHRIKWAGMMRKGKTESQKFQDLTDKSIALDRANTARMREIVNEYGWPTYELVGEGASNNAWLIVQHADRNPLFQIKCLPLLKDAVDQGQANPSNYAYLYDRVQVAKGEKQLYATQSSSNNGLVEGTFYPLDDESNVQKRREEMNISRNVEEYATSMGFSYTIPDEEEAMERADKLAKDYNTHLKMAKEAMSKAYYNEAADYYLKVVSAYGSVQQEDFVEAARALSLAKHKEIKTGTRLLTKALVGGWDGLEHVKTNSDFANLREASKFNWEDFLTTANEMNLDK